MQTETIETNLQGIAQQIFSVPPKPPRTIQLGLDEYSAEGATESTPLEVIRLLSLLGMQVLFDHQDVMKLSESDFNLLKQYINSTGFDIVVTCNSTTSSPWEVLLHNEQIREIQVRFRTLPFA